jgi:glycogen debranching enzyme
MQGVPMNSPRPPAGPDQQQPWLHDLSTCVDGNVTALSARSGQIDGTGAQGVFIDDRRIISVLDVWVGGEEAVSVAAASLGDRSEFLGSLRHLGDRGEDPTVELRRERHVTGGGCLEVLHLTSRAAREVSTQLVLHVGGDGAPIVAVKAGVAAGTACLAADTDGRTARWHDDWHAVSVAFEPAPDSVLTSPVGEPTTATFSVRVPPGGTVTISAAISVTRTRDSNLDAEAGSGRMGWDAISAVAGDNRVEPTVRSGLADLRHLLLADPADPRDVFAAAGTPWYLALFGRDSIWSARMVLPFGTEVAAGTLRALARRQGTRTDHSRAEAPGKIPHEIRRAPFSDPGSNLALPQEYYGTIDATPLWMVLLHDAWRWGMPPGEVEQLLPQLRAAARWLTDYSSPDGDGLLRYLDQSGSGLENQGWKDSGDAIRWRDGRVAQAPIALVEAQGYAVEAANDAADLYDAFGQEGGSELRGWAADLAKRVRDRFWLEGPAGGYLGIAVDAAGDTVDGMASNMGHLLGTGALSTEEVAHVAGTLTSEPMLGPHGIRTLAADNGGYNPMGYHTGSVWTHDTAICAWGLAREGHRDEAARVARTLLASAAAFDYRWPELYAGFTVADQPVPYPAACRPQAWAAASSAVLISVALGFEPDAPAGRLTLRPARPAAFGPMTVRGLRFAGSTFDVECQANGDTVILGAPGQAEIRIV